MLNDLPKNCVIYFFSLNRKDNDANRGSIYRDTGSIRTRDNVHIPKTPLKSHNLQSHRAFEHSDMERSSSCTNDRLGAFLERSINIFSVQSTKNVPKCLQLDQIWFQRESLTLSHDPRILETLWAENTLLLMASQLVIKWLCPSPAIPEKDLSRFGWFRSRAWR